MRLKTFLSRGIFCHRNWKMCKITKQVQATEITYSCFRKIFQNKLKVNISNIMLLFITCYSERCGVTLKFEYNESFFEPKMHQPMANTYIPT